MEHNFNTEIAKECGVYEAIIIHHIFFWIKKNAANGKHYYDGSWWTYCSHQAFTQLFPYFSKDQIKRILSSLQKCGYILKGNYNKNRFDRTVWYALSKKGISLLNDNGYVITTHDKTNSSHGEDEIASSDAAISPDEYNNINNTYIITDNNTDNNINYDVNLLNNKEIKENTKRKKEYPEIPEKFVEFVKLYKKLTETAVRGVKTEFDDFKKHHKDWKDVIPYLAVAITRETKARNEANSKRTFFPAPKRLKTYLGPQRAWELYVTVGEDISDISTYYLPHGHDVHYIGEKFFYTGTTIGGIFDGYTDDDRPDGAEMPLNNARGSLMWDASHKQWVKMEYEP